MRALSPEECRLVSGGDGNTVTEVVIVGAIPPQWINWNTVALTPGSFAAYSGWGTGAPPAQAPTGSHQVTVVCRDDHKDACQQAADVLSAGVARIDDQLRNLPDSAMVTLSNTTGDSQVLTVAEAKNIWSHVDFKITDPSLTGTLASGGGGSVTHDAAGWHDEISYTALISGSFYNNSSLSNNEGVNFMILHEFSHMTQVDQDRHQYLYHSYTEGDKTPTQAEWMNTMFFKQDERFANDLAKDLANTLGLPVMANPPFGYKGQPLQ